jgi:hypothetical protein
MKGESVMNHPVIVNANATERLNRMLSEADNHRLMKKVSVQKSGRNIVSEIKKRFPILGGQGVEESASSPA